MSETLLQSNNLAINGGSPVRNKPFLASCYISGKEKELVNECLDSNQWSTFKGGTEGWDINEVGVMTSKEATKYGPLENRFLGGKFVREFEYRFAEKINTAFGVSANSATSALIMALGACNLGPGDEVIVPCMSFNATATAVLFFNSIPVFAEVKADTFCLDPEDLKTKISEYTKAIIVVHLGGNTADMDKIMSIAKENNLKVIEDCAQAPGVTYKGRQVGSIGDAGVFSLTETKNITCGEGGMLTTNDENIAFKARLIRNHGEGVALESWSDKELCNIVGMNFRLTEIQAAIAIPQLESLDERNRIRKENAQYLIDKLSRYSELVAPAIENGADYTCFMLKWKYTPSQEMPTRDQLADALIAEGIPIIKGYGRMMYENPIFARKIAFGTKGSPFTDSSYKGKALYGTGTCPKSEEVNNKFIWFKYINPPNTTEDMDDVVAAFEKILGNR